MGARGKAAMEGAGMCDGQLVHVASRSYSLACNWKVFVDNYLVRDSAGLCSSRMCMAAVPVQCSMALAAHASLCRMEDTMWRWRIPSWRRGWTCQPTGASCLSGCPSRHAPSNARLLNNG